MKKLLLIIIVSLFIMGCSSTEKPTDPCKDKTWISKMVCKART